MSNLRDIKIGVPIAHDARSTGVLSGTFDTYGASRVIAYVVKTAFSGKNSKQVLRIRHANTAATYTSATAFSTPVIASGSTSSGAQVLGPFTVDMQGKGRYLVFLLSNVTASAKTGVIALGMQNEVVPPALTGFTSVTGVKDAPSGP